jgi:amino acid transporter
VNQNATKLFHVNLSGLKPWLIAIGIFWLLGTIGLGWLVKSFLVLTIVLLIAPVIIFFGVSWWWQNNLVADKCPVCSYEFTGFKTNSFQCPNCGEPLQITKNHFQRLTPPDTIDIQAIEVPVETLEESEI